MGINHLKHLPTPSNFFSFPSMACLNPLKPILTSCRTSAMLLVVFLMYLGPTFLSLRCSVRVKLKLGPTLQTWFCWHACLIFMSLKGSGYRLWHFAFTPNPQNFLSVAIIVELGCGPYLFEPKGECEDETNHAMLHSFQTWKFPPRVATLLCWDVGLTFTNPRGV